MPSISQKELDILQGAAAEFDAQVAELEYHIKIRDARIDSFHEILLKIVRAIDGFSITNINSAMTTGGQYTPGEALSISRPKLSRNERQEQELRDLHALVSDLSNRLVAARTAIEFAFEHKA